jgi:hypothetical protein
MDPKFTTFCLLLKAILAGYLVIGKHGLDPGGLGLGLFLLLLQRSELLLELVLVLRMFICMSIYLYVLDK